MTQHATRTKESSPSVGRTNQAERSRGMGVAASRQSGPAPLAAAGNQTVQRLFAEGAIHPKLRIGSPDDPAEREADRVARDVVQGNAPCTCAAGGGAPCPSCVENAPREVRRKPKRVDAGSRDSAAGNPAFGSGRPLSESERSFFEPRLGADISSVRIHTDDAAERSAETVKARAFTVGSDISFGRGEYSAQSREGRLLLAHELTHVVQQRAGAQLDGGIGEEDDQYEQQADAVADAVVNERDAEPLLALRRRVEPSPLKIQRICRSCADNAHQKWLQPRRKPGGGNSGRKLARVEGLVSSPGVGQPVPGSVRARTDPVLNADLSGVRVHSDARAQRAAQDINAKAFTYGNNIFQGPGQSGTDLALMAHELTHTVQQHGPVFQPPPTQGVGMHRNGPSRRHAMGPGALPGRIARKAQSDAAPGDGENARDDLSLAESALLELVRFASPNVADLIENGADNLLEQVFNEGLGTIFEEVSGSLNVQELVAEVTTSMAGMAVAINRGDKDACAFLSSRLEGFKAFIDDFFASETFDVIQTKIDVLHEQVSMVRALFLKPAFEEVMEVLGERFAKVKELIALISAGASIRASSGEAAWEWVCEYFGIDSSSEGGLAEWLLAKAKEIWDKISAELEPLMGPLTVIGGVLAMGSPFGAIQLVREGLVPLADGIQWLLAHRDDPELIANAREELGDTYLPRLLEGLEALNTQLAGSLEGVLEPLGQLVDAIAGAAKVLSGVASGLSGFIQSIREAVAALLAWASDTWGAITAAIGTLSAEAWAAIRPILAVLSSVAFAIAGFPAATVFVIAGWGWTLLCPELRVQILEVLLHLAQTALASVELPEIYGLLQSGIAAFLESLHARLEVDQEAVLAALDNVAMTIAGANPEFVLGFAGGLGVGIVEGIFDPLLLVWDIFSMGAQIQMWAMSMAAGQISSAVSTAAQLGEDAIMGITQEAAANLTPEIMERFAELAATLQPIVGALQERFMPALESLMAGEGMTYEQVIEYFGTLWPTIEAGITGYANELANGLIDLLQDPSGISWSAGYNMGWLTGTVSVQLVATFCSFGVVEAVLGTSKAARLVIGAIKLADNVLGEAFTLLGKFADEVIQMVSTLAGKLSDLAKGALREVFELALKAFDEIKRFIDEAMAIFLKRGGKVVDEAGEKLAKELAEEAAEKAAKEAAERAAKEAAEKGAKEVAEEVAKKGDELVDATPDRTGKTGDKDRDKEIDEDDTDEKRAARLAAGEAWTDLSAYAAKDLRTYAEMKSQLARQDARVLGASISYDMEESGDTWSVEATARGDLGDTAKRDAGSGWIARDGTKEYYGNTSAESADKAVALEILDELDAKWDELCETVEQDEGDKLQTEASRLATEKKARLPYDALAITATVSNVEFTNEQSAADVHIRIAPNADDGRRTLVRRRPGEKQVRIEFDLNGAPTALTATTTGEVPVYITSPIHQPENFVPYLQDGIRTIEDHPNQKLASQWRGALLKLRDNVTHLEDLQAQIRLARTEKVKGDVLAVFYKDLDRMAKTLRNVGAAFDIQSLKQLAVDLFYVGIDGRLKPNFRGEFLRGTFYPSSYDLTALTEKQTWAITNAKTNAAPLAALFQHYRIQQSEQQYFWYCPVCRQNNRGSAGYSCARSSRLQQSELVRLQETAESFVETHQVIVMRQHGGGDPGIGDVVAGQPMALAQARLRRLPFIINKLGMCCAPRCATIRVLDR